MKLSMCPLGLVNQVGVLSYVVFKIFLFYVFQSTYSVQVMHKKIVQLVSGRAGVQIQANLRPGP